MGECVRDPPRVALGGGVPGSGLRPAGAEGSGVAGGAGGGVQGRWDPGHPGERASVTTCHPSDCRSSFLYVRKRTWHFFFEIKV